MKVRLDNQFSIASRKLQIDSEKEFTDQKNMAILYERVRFNLQESLIPALFLQKD